MTGQDWLEKDFYKALDVSKDADDAAIKKAYRKLARKHHPDQNYGDAQAEAKFKEIGEAYAVLSDKEERQKYDSIRAMAGGGARFSAGSGGQGGAGFEDMFGGMFGGGGGGNTRFSTQSGGGGYEDLFGGLFGGGGRSTYRQPQAGGDLAASVTLSFRSAVEGQTVNLTVDGKTLKTRIPAGVHDGQKIRLRGKGRPGIAGGPAGDLIITVRVAEHPIFSMQGNNLRLTMPVTFAEAALGTTLEVPTLTGERVKLKVAPGTPNGRVLRVKGRGIAAKSGTGDLLVTLSVTVPQKLSDAARSAIEAFAEATASDDVRAGLFEQAQE